MIGEAFSSEVEAGSREENASNKNADVHTVMIRVSQNIAHHLQVGSAAAGDKHWRIAPNGWAAAVTRPGRRGAFRASSSIPPLAPLAATSHNVGDAACLRDDR